MPLPSELIEKIENLLTLLEDEKDQYNDVLNSQLMAGTLTNDLANASLEAKKNFAARTSNLLASLDVNMDYISQDSTLFLGIYYSNFFSKTVGDLALTIAKENERLTSILGETIENNNEFSEEDSQINNLKKAILSLCNGLYEAGDNESLEFASICSEYITRLNDPTDVEIYEDIASNVNLPMHISDQAKAMAFLIKKSHASSEKGSDSEDNNNNTNNCNTKNKRKLSTLKHTSKPKDLLSTAKKVRSDEKSYKELLNDLGGTIEAVPTSFAAIDTVPATKKQEDKPATEEKAEEKDPSVASHAI